MELTIKCEQTHTIFSINISHTYITCTLSISKGKDVAEMLPSSHVFWNLLTRSNQLSNKQQDKHYYYYCLAYYYATATSVLICYMNKNVCGKIQKRETTKKVLLLYYLREILSEDPGGQPFCLFNKF